MGRRRATESAALNCISVLNVSVVKNRESKDTKNKSRFAASFAMKFQISLAGN
jgi:hypothetical protein